MRAPVTPRSGRLLAGEPEPGQVLADSAYGTGDLRAELPTAGQRSGQSRGRRATVPGGFTVDDFTVDHDARTVTCPAGLTRPISRSGFVTFGAACRGCPLRAAVHHQRHRRSPEGRPPRRAATGRSRGQPKPGLAERLPPAPADGRTHHRVADPRRTAGCATAASPRTTTGCITAPPRSTCADCITLGLTHTGTTWALA